MLCGIFSRGDTRATGSRHPRCRNRLNSCLERQKIIENNRAIFIRRPKCQQRHSTWMVRQKFLEIVTSSLFWLLSQKSGALVTYLTDSSSRSESPSDFILDSASAFFFLSFSITAGGAFLTNLSLPSLFITVSRNPFW